MERQTAFEKDNGFPQGEHHDAIADTCNTMIKLGDVLCSNSDNKLPLDAFIALANNYITREKLDVLRVAQEPCFPGRMEAANPLIIAHLKQSFTQKLQSLSLYETREAELRRAVGRCEDFLLVNSEEEPHVNSWGKLPVTPVNHNPVAEQGATRNHIAPSQIRLQEGSSDSKNDCCSSNNLAGSEPWSNSWAKRSVSDHPLLSRGADHQGCGCFSAPFSRSYTPDDKISESICPKSCQNDAPGSNVLQGESEAASTEVHRPRGSVLSTDHSESDQSSEPPTEPLFLWKPDLTVKIDVSMNVPNEDFSDPPAFSNYRERFDAIMLHKRQGLNLIPHFFRYGIRYLPRDYLELENATGPQPMQGSRVPESRVVMFYNLPKSLGMAEFLRFVRGGKIVRAFILGNTGYVDFEDPSAARRCVGVVNSLKTHWPRDLTQLGCGPMELSPMPTYPIDHESSHALHQGFTRCLGVQVPGQVAALKLLDILNGSLFPGIEDILEDAWLRYDGLERHIQDGDGTWKATNTCKMIISFNSVLNASRGSKILESHNLDVYIAPDPCCLSFHIGNLRVYESHSPPQHPTVDIRRDIGLARGKKPSVFQQWKDAKQKAEDLLSSSETTSACNTTSKSHYTDIRASAAQSELIQLDTPTCSPRNKGKEIHISAEQQPNTSLPFQFSTMDDFDSRWNYEGYRADRTRWQENLDVLAEKNKKTEDQNQEEWMTDDWTTSPTMEHSGSRNTATETIGINNKNDGVVVASKEAKYLLVDG